MNFNHPLDEGQIRGVEFVYGADPLILRLVNEIRRRRDADENTIEQLRAEIAMQSHLISALCKIHPEALTFDVPAIQSLDQGQDNDQEIGEETDADPMGNRF